MSARQTIMDALKNRLQSASSSLGLVEFWRDARVQAGEPSTTFRDVSSTEAMTNNQVEHHVRVEIESYCSGADLGVAMNAQLSTIVQLLRDPLQTTPRPIVRVTETRSEIIGDGHEVGGVAVVLDVEYRTPSFQI